MDEIHGQADIAPPQPHGHEFIQAYNFQQGEMAGNCHLRMFS